MECDWEFDIAPEAPVIDALWAGRVDLQAHPDEVQRLPEAANLPALAEALALLNAPECGVWTSKCDLWTEQNFDPDELDSTPAHAAFSLACYIDLLPATVTIWSTAEEVAQWCRQACARLRAIPVRDCRVDLIIRSACLRAGQFDLGVTTYAIGCGASPDQASYALSKALIVLAQTIVAPGNGSKYNETYSGE